MLRGMAGKARIAIVGAGNLGAALAGSLYAAGYSIDAVVGHAKGKSRARAQKLVREVGARYLADLADLRATVIWFCVPDSAVGAAAREVALKFDWTGKFALHSSGALTSDELGSLRRGGAKVASVHPLMTFVRGSRPDLAGVPFAIEGDAAAARVARKIVQDLGAQSYAIRKADKAAYHTWGTFASPLLTALLATTEQIGVAAGVERKQVARRMMPILLQTLANYGKVGAAAGFSGPLVRGDAETVRRHLRMLRRVPAAREVYLALATAALEYLPTRNRNALKQLLSSARD